MEQHNNKINSVLIVMTIGAFIGSLSQSLLTSALPAVMKEFAVSANIGQWLTTVYIMVLGVITAITAFLIEKHNLKNLFIGAMLLFLTGCIASLFSNNFIILICSRVIQACGAGILLPLVQIVALRTLPSDRHGKAMGIAGLVVGFAPAIGPAVSGFLVDYFGWRSIFLFLTAISLSVIFLALFIFRNMKNIGNRINGKMDLISAILYGLGFCSLMLGVTNQAGFGWLNFHTLLPVLIGLSFLIIFVVRQLKLPVPLLEIKIFHNYAFAVTTIIVIIAYIAMVSGTIIVPIYIQSVRNLSAVISGVVLLPGSILVAVFMPVVGHMLDKYGVRILSITGMIFLIIGTIAFAFFGMQTPLIWVSFMYSMRLMGVSFLIMPLTVYGLSGLEKRYISHGTAIVTSLRQMAGALGSSVLVVIMVSASQNIKNIDCHGVNVTFGIQTGVFVVCLLWLLTVMFFRHELKKQI